MLALTFWKVSLKGKAFTFIRIPPVAVVAVIIIMGGVMAVVMVMVVVAVVITPRKSSGKNPKKSSPRRKRGVPLGFLMQKGVQVGVISIPLNTLPV